MTDSSFHRSFWRCVTIHGTNKVRVERNVAFDVVGHCLYLEDGVEEENVISFNLFAHIHVMGKPPGDSGTAQWLDNIYDTASLREPSDSTASAFYISRGAASLRAGRAPFTHTDLSPAAPTRAFLLSLIHI